MSPAQPVVRFFVVSYDKRHKGFVHHRNEPALACWMGDGPALTTDGYGGWDQNERIRSKPLTVWTGGHLFQMTVPILFTGWAREAQVDSACRRLERMGRKEAGDVEPPVLRCRLPGESPRGDQQLWVLDSIEWGDSRRRASDGKRVHQEAVVTLLEYQRPDTVHISPAKHRRHKKKKKRKRKR